MLLTEAAVLHNYYLWDVTSVAIRQGISILEEGL